MLELNLSRAQLRVLSNVFGNFVVVWIVAMFGTRNILVLTANFVLAIISWRLAVKVEEILEEL
ncbi:MAG: hypothetical protein A2868_02345 [Candidatus Levybacteria bacterium RIFCSPHIGHO2_01_FULL_40_15b]|nr:MAG: hypothetical protein A2868_02345 [Candidatus Levybacteria bacterium RIFCSPHIGHO2_01_FULL_40_15b]